MECMVVAYRRDRLFQSVFFHRAHRFLGRAAKSDRRQTYRRNSDTIQNRSSKNTEVITSSEFNALQFWTPMRMGPQNINVLGPPLNSRAMARRRGEGKYACAETSSNSPCTGIPHTSTQLLAGDD